MSKLKKSIAIIICFIIILGILMILMKNANRNLQKEQQSDEAIDLKREGEKDEIRIEEDDIQISEYFIVKKCIKEYLEAMYSKSPSYELKNNNFDQNLAKDKVYNILSQNYIEKNNITKQNVLDKIPLLDYRNIFYPIEIKELHDGNVKTYKAMGINQDINKNNKKLFHCVINISTENSTFSVEPVNEKEYNNYNAEKLEKIENKEYNVYVESKTENNTIAVECFENFLNTTLANPKYTFEKMNEQYRKERFGTLENYQQYIRDNLTEYKELKAEEYTTNISNKDMQYVIKDQYQNLYIFDAKNPVDYTVTLDTYTISTDKFNSTYDKANNSKKCQMNIDKFFQMINRHDYKTSYNVIAESFKQTYSIDNEEIFKRIAKDTFFDYNKIEFKKFQELSDNTYEYQIKLKDLTGNSSETKDIIIIMQLQENRKFIMSFSENK